MTTKPQLGAGATAMAGQGRSPLAMAVLALVLVTACDARRASHNEPGAPLSTGTGPHAAASAPTVTRPEAATAFVVRYTGGASAEQALPLVVVLHGLGDSPDHFVRVYTQLPVAARVVAPPGFNRYHGGYSWFPVDLSGKRAIAHAADVKASAVRLSAWIDTLTKTYPTRGKPIVTGFSQGGMLTFALTAYFPDQLGAAFPIGGALDPREVPAAAPSDAPPLMAFHGQADPLVRFAPTAELVNSMKTRGYRATMRSYPDLGHSISAALRTDLYAALKGAIDTQANRQD